MLVAVVVDIVNVVFVLVDTVVDVIVAVVSVPVLLVTVLVSVHGVEPAKHVDIDFGMNPTQRPFGY